MKGWLLIAAVLLAAPAAAQEFDLRACEVRDSPDFRHWPVTTTIERLELRATGVHVRFGNGKQDGPNRWPDIIPPGWDGPVQYSVGMVMVVNGRCYASAPIEYWHGLPQAGGFVQDPTVRNPDTGVRGQVAANWFYAARWAPMNRQPVVGELVGFFVCAGTCRGRVDGSGSPVKERSNVVAIAWPPATEASYPPFLWAEEVTTPVTPPIVVTPPPVIVPPVVPPHLPPPIPLPAVDTCSAQIALLRAELAVVNQNITAGREENRGFFQRVAGEWKRIVGVASLIGGGILTGRLAK